MEVLSFSGENVKIIVNTAADIANCWHRFYARIKDNALTYCDYHSTLIGSLKLSVPSNNFQLTDIISINNCQWLEQPPVFYETAIYNVSIYFTEVENPPCILHKLKKVTELFTVLKIGENRWLLSAPLSFLNEPGIFDLAFRYKPCVGDAYRVDTFSFRVVSPKLDTKYDYNSFLSEINAVYKEIVFQYLTLTLQNLNQGGRSNNDIIWLSLFRNLAKDYERWVRFIVNKPHLRQTREIRFSRAEQIKKWTPQMAEQYVQLKKEHRLGHEYFRHEEIIHTHNTRENKFVKFTIDHILKRLIFIVNTIKTNNAKAKESDKIADNEIVELEGYVTSLKQLEKSSLFRNIIGKPLHSESIVIQKRNGYAQVYKHWLLLQKGIDFFEGSNTIGIRPIWELYELWCFLKMRQMVADILNLHFDNPKEIIEKPMPMIQPFENNNQEHIVYYNCVDGSKVRLHYQHTYNRRSGEVHTATTENRPDIVLTVIKADDIELTYLFDAKYRLLDNNKFNQENREEQHINNAVDTPPYDAINQMHRYRDAIYYGSNQYSHTSKEIIGGYILFPGRGTDESIRKQFFYKSIETINIGAFPLLPNASNPSIEGSLLYEFLTKILTIPHTIDHIKNAIPQRGLKYYAAEEKDLVLVGYYKKEQYQAIINNKLYYVPAALGKGSINLISGFEKTKYLLLHHGKDRVLVRLRGEGPKFYPRTALEALGFKPNGDFYLAFEIKDFDPVQGIDPNTYELERTRKQIAVPYFTTLDKFR